LDYSTFGIKKEIEKIKGIALKLIFILSEIKNVFLLRRILQ
jgi:hypothetical protein